MHITLLVVVVVLWRFGSKKLVWTSFLLLLHLITYFRMLKNSTDEFTQSKYIFIYFLSLPFSQAKFARRCKTIQHAKWLELRSGH